MYNSLKPHIKPKQAPHPPIGVAGLSKGSDTLKLAGERGFIPMSLNLNPAYVGSHWESVEAGAARPRRKPNPPDWRGGGGGVGRRTHQGSREVFPRRMVGRGSG